MAASLRDQNISRPWRLRFKAFLIRLFEGDQKGRIMHKKVIVGDLIKNTSVRSVNSRLMSSATLNDLTFSPVVSRHSGAISRMDVSAVGERAMRSMFEKNRSQ